MAISILLNLPNFASNENNLTFAVWDECFFTINKTMNGTTYVRNCKIFIRQLNFTNNKWYPMLDGFGNEIMLGVGNNSIYSTHVSVDVAGHFIIGWVQVSSEIVYQDNFTSLNAQKVYFAEYFAANATWSPFPMQASDAISFPNTTARTVKIAQNRISGKAMMVWEQGNDQYYNGSKVVMSTYTPPMFVGNSTIPGFWMHPLQVFQPGNISTLQDIFVWKEIITEVPMLEENPEIACSDIADCLIAISRVYPLVPGSFPNPAIVYVHIQAANASLNRTATTLYDSASFAGSLLPISVSIDSSDLNAIITWRQGQKNEINIFINHYTSPAKIFICYTNADCNSNEYCDIQSGICYPINNRWVVPTVVGVVAGVVALAVPGYIWGLPRLLVPIKNMCGCNKKQLDKKIREQSIGVKEGNLEKSEIKMQELDEM